jgi:hypothetical protein
LLVAAPICTWNVELSIGWTVNEYAPPAFVFTVPTGTDPVNPQACERIWTSWPTDLSALVPWSVIVRPNSIAFADNARVGPLAGRAVAADATTKAAATSNIIRVPIRRMIAG